MKSLPADVAAYLEQATIALAQEQNFIPASERDMLTWIEGNHRLIAIRAQVSMESMVSKFLASEQMMDEAAKVLGERVYNTIPKAGAAKWNPRYLAYATEHGATPEQMLARDGNMANFLCWASRSTSKA